MSYIQDIYSHCLKQPVHNQACLQDYDLYQREGKQYISYALLKDFGEVEIIAAGEKLPAIIELHEWNYICPANEAGKFNTRFICNIPVRNEGGRIFLSHQGLNPNFNLFIKVNQDITPLFHDTSLESKLIPYYNAGEINDFGCKIQDHCVEFKVWSPPAGRVQVILFDKQQNLIETAIYLDLKRGSKGVWQGRFTPDDVPEVRSFEGLSYQYLVYSYGKVRLALDPFAWSMSPYDPVGADKIGKAAIIDRNKIKPLKDGFSNKKILSHPIDMIACEAHIRDFTSEPGFVPTEETGTFEAFAQNIPHFVKTGFTHIQLMPVMKFSNINETDRTLNGINNGFANYNWGYDAHHFFSPEGWYSTQPEDPYTRIFELQKLVQDMHESKLGLIYDVVYNHTYLAETLENIAPGWYYRKNQELKISGHTGAGAGLETRFPMVRKLIIESLKHFITYYGADGFRFDLVSFFDHETIKLIRQEAGKTYDAENIDQLILHGEGWNFTDLPLEQACTKLNPPDISLHFAMFNDTIRDGLMGHLLNQGSIHGKTWELPRLASGITAGIKNFNPGNTDINHPEFFAFYNMFTTEPEQCLNLISIHDGFTLWDKLNLTVNHSREHRAKLLCQAATVIFTSQGKIIWHGGEEFLRSKPLGNNGKEPWRAHNSDFAESTDGVNTFHENSFGAPDFTNMIRRNPFGGESAAILEQVKDYVSGLIELRKKIPALHYHSANEIRQGLSFIGPVLQNYVNETFNYTDFRDPELKKLSLKFINGPANTTCYVCGEVHPKNVDGNPAHNRFSVVFNEKGVAEITFTEQEIHFFDVGKWGSSLDLRIKLILNPGTWDTIDYAYSSHGNNVIFPQAINKKGEVLIDLSVPDFSTTQFPEPRPYLAFVVKSKENSLPWSSVLVIHNFSDDYITIELEILKDKKMTILADGNTASFSGLLSSPNISFVENGNVTVRSHTSVILGVK